MAGVGIEILVEDTTGSRRAGKRKKRQTKKRKRTRMRRRTKKRRRKAMVQKTRGGSTSGKRTGEDGTGAREPKEAAPGAEGLKREALEVGGPRGGVPRVREPIMSKFS